MHWFLWEGSWMMMESFQFGGPRRQQLGTNKKLSALQTKRHSMGKRDVNGALQNFDEFPKPSDVLLQCGQLIKNAVTIER
jgi:hypothetical protein